MWIDANLLCKLATEAAKHPSHPNILPSQHPTNPHIGWQPPQKIQAPGINNIASYKHCFHTHPNAPWRHACRWNFESLCVHLQSCTLLQEVYLCTWWWAQTCTGKMLWHELLAVRYRFQKVVHECTSDYLEFIEYFMCHRAWGTQASMFADIFMMAWCLQILAVGQNNARQIWAPPSNRSELESHNLHCIQMWEISSLDPGLDNSHLSIDYTSTSKLYRIYGQQPYDSGVFHNSKTSAWRYRLHEHSDGPKDPSKLSNGPT